MPDFQPGDVVRVSGTSAGWFLEPGPFIVKAYPSTHWVRDEDRVALKYVDLVNMDGSPLRRSHKCIYPCANINDCTHDVFLTESRRANGLGPPEHTMRTDLSGWQYGT